MQSGEDVARRQTLLREEDNTGRLGRTRPPDACRCSLANSADAHTTMATRVIQRSSPRERQRNSLLAEMFVTLVARAHHRLEH